MRWNRQYVFQMNSSRILCLKTKRNNHNLNESEKHISCFPCFFSLKKSEESCWEFNAFLQEAKEHGLSQSLFKRLSKTNTTPVQYLNEQYRMHPEICKFPNEYFYHNLLVTNPLAIDETFPWKPYGVFSLEYTNQNQGDPHSTSNNAVGLDFVCTLLKVMLTKTPTRTCSYGIITPYSQQRNDLADKVRWVCQFREKVGRLFFS